VAELDSPLTPLVDPDPRLPAPSAPLPFGDVPGGRHVEIGSAGLDRAALDELTTSAAHLVVTPWRGLLIPNVQESP
jgi:precorrin-3B synthase